MIIGTRKARDSSSKRAPLKEQGINPTLPLLLHRCRRAHPTQPIS
jgi:hypothetical protein